MSQQKVKREESVFISSDLFETQIAQNAMSTPVVFVKSGKSNAITQLQGLYGMHLLGVGYAHNRP